MPAPTTAPAQAPAAPPLSRRKRAAFTAAMLALPLVLLGVAEGALRLAGYGGYEPLFVPVPGAPDYRYQNREVARRYFARQANVPTGLFDFFRAEKDSSVYRIVVMGESSAAGFPFYYGAAFSRQLQQRLQQTFPDRTIEVVNTALAAVSSYTLRDFAGEILDQKPDAVLVYAGHNEYYGALGVGSSESLGRTPGLVNLYLRLQRLRVVQALRAGIARVMAAGAPALDTREGTTLMERMVGEQRIVYGSRLDRAGDRQLEANLGALLGRFREAGVPVYVGTLASNERDQPPFVSAAAQNPEAFAGRVRAAEALARTDSAGARRALEALVAEDSVDAASRYALARLVDAAGDARAARPLYLAAKDRDGLRFRAPERFNALLRRLARDHGATVVESQAALAAASPGGIIGHELMTEHLHPTPEGYFHLADAFYEALRATQAIGTWTAPVPAADARREMLLTPMDSLVGTYRLLQLKGSWPFQPVGVRATTLDTLRARTWLDSLALRLFRGDLAWNEANDLQRDGFAARGDLHRALQSTLAAIQEYPFADGPYLSAGTILIQQGRRPEALAYFEAAFDRTPSAVAEAMIGSLLLDRGDAAGARRRLESALRRDARNEQALYNLAGLDAQEGRPDAARARLRALLAVNPDRADARALLAQIEQTGNAGRGS